MKDEEILNKAKERYQEACGGWDHIYSALSEDMRFAYDIDGGQWPDQIRAEREGSGRPIITVNKIQKFLRQVRGDQQQNRPRIKVIPVDHGADVQMAKLYNDLIRQIEYLSDASIAYDTAYMHAISSSVGFFRLVTDYADDSSFDQDIFIKRITNPLAVHFDPSALDFEYRDAKYCFVEELMLKEDFQKKYPKAEAMDFDTHKTDFGDWMQGDSMRIAEYFYKDPVKKKIVLLEDGQVVELTKEVTPELIYSQGGVIVRERDVNSHKVMWCKMTGAEILETKEWPGKDIPIIPVLGDEIVINGKRHYLSLIRGAKDPQRMYNYHATAATEAIGLAPKAPFIIDHRQVKGFESEWEEANRTNRMYIRYNAVAGLQKPSREHQTEVPSGIMAMMQSTAFDIEDHLGRYEASKGQASNERSGIAIRERVNQADKGTYTFVDNLTRAIVYAGRQIIDLIPKIYDTPRALMIMDESGEQQSTEVNKPYMDAGGNVSYENDLTVGKYDLVATVGASYSSKRQEMVEALIQSMQYAPDFAGVIAPLVFKYSDYPGSDEIAAKIEQHMQKMQQQPQE